MDKQSETENGRKLGSDAGNGQNMQKPQLHIKPQDPFLIMMRTIEWCIFSGRWLLAPMYLGLLVALGIYLIRFSMELLELIKEFHHMTEAQVMLAVVGLVDITMVANLVCTTNIGSYSSFVRKIDFKQLENRPQGFTHLTSGLLKVKMGMSLLGISSIHLLKRFIEADSVKWYELSILLSIHGIFIISTICLAVVDRMYHPAISDHDSEGEIDNEHLEKH